MGHMNAVHAGTNSPVEKSICYNRNLLLRVKKAILNYFTVSNKTPCLKSFDIIVNFFVLYYQAAKGEGWAPPFISCAQDTVGL